MDGIIQQSFSLNLKIMRVLRLYPPENSTNAYKVQAHILYFIYVIPISFLGILYFLLEDNIDFMEVGDTALFMSEATCYIGKILPFVRHGAKIKKFIHYFDNSQFATHNDRQKKIIEDCIRSCRRTSLLYTTGIICGLINWNTKPLLLGGNRLPIQIWLPFDPAAGPITYWSVYLYLATGMAYLTFSGTLIDPLIGGLAYHAACQLKVLKDNLQHLQGHPEEQIYGKIKQCVDHYSAVLSFVQEYEEWLSWSIFSQFAASSFAICFCCLQLSMMESYDFNSVVLVIYIFLLMAQIYFYCYYGTLMFEESYSLTNAIYMGNWYEYDVKSRKALIMIMERSKRPMIVTVGKIVEMSIDTFVVVIRRSFSLLAVFKNFQ